ncbi:apyrase-like [Trichogramma pretiosum]|uniref:apyrase-like n=1 Tax=Trichogramma pretiosum TaxID=7493 RepID=UPI0006C94468|nr:apyrase-like [Trichogramma pretiosum]
MLWTREVGSRFRESVFCLWLLCLVAHDAAHTDSSFELSVVHFSDFHSRYVEVAPNGGLCYEKSKCVGGVARLGSIIKRLASIRKNPIVLNAGDSFQGTLYYELYRGNITAHFMNLLPHDAMTLGNHDFDDHVSGLVSYLKQLKSPVLDTNIDVSGEPSLQGLLFNSTIIEKGGRNIGIIGVIASDTDELSTTTGNVKFLAEAETINLEAARLKSHGVDIIIVLSHCGIEHDKLIAQNCPLIDVIVGGHSHILLYNGTPPSGEKAYDKYPIVVTQETGRKVLIVHSGPFTKYIGDIRIVFNDVGEVKYWKGNPIYLDQSIKEDENIVNELKPWKIMVDKVGKQLIGRTMIYLNNSCDSNECNFGDFITDAMIDYYAAQNATIGFMTANSISNSIPVGPIFYEDLYATMAYANTWDLIELRGCDLLQVLEENVSNGLSKVGFMNPELIQWSGLKVTYDLKRDHSKLVNVQIRNQESNEFKDLDKQEWYKIVVPTYMLSDAFPIIVKKHRKIMTGKDRDLNIMIDYIKRLKVVDLKFEPRMIFI